MQCKKVNGMSCGEDSDCYCDRCSEYGPEDGPIGKYCSVDRGSPLVTIIIYVIIFILIVVGWIFGDSCNK